MKRRAAALAAVLVAGSHLAGQTLDVRAGVAAPKSSARLGGVTERADGIWAGMAVDLRVGRFALSARGSRGRLTSSQAGVVPRRDVGEVAASARCEVRPGIGVEVGYTARAFSSASGHQRWDMGSIGVAGTRSVGTPAVQVFALLAYLPVVKLRTGEHASFGLGSDVGISVAPTRSPVTLALQYRIERFRFASATGRAEQFEVLTLSAGLRAWRHAGRWGLGETR